MEAVKPVAGMLFFALFFFRPIGCGEHGRAARPGQRESGPIPPPTNLVMTHHNFETTLRWDYKETSATPLFTVYLKDYNSGQWQLFRPCINIAVRICNVTKKLRNPNNYYYAKVTATVGSRNAMSNATSGFSFEENGTIGPPNITAVADGQNMHVEIWYPLTPFRAKSRQKNIRDFYEDFTYKISVFESGNQNKAVMYHPDNCTKDKCVKMISIPKEGGNYCVLAKGISENANVNGAESPEKCVYIQSKEVLEDRISSIVVVVAGIIVGILIISAVSFLGWKIVKTQTMLWPKSLVNLVREKNTYFSFEGKTDISSLSVVSNTTLSPVTPEEEVLVEELKHLNLEGGTSGTDAIQEFSAEAEKLVTKEDTVTMDISAEPADATESRNMVSDAEAVDASGIPTCADIGEPDTELLGATREADGCDSINSMRILTTTVCRKSFGYDKPHAPLFVELSDEDIAKGYKPTIAEAQDGSEPSEFTDFGKTE
ncbi:interferon gamma receptor 1-like [Latimeria chalumnae]|uniref:Fibronectin type-III domain-containing protein n=1 Tax=Latimeria chalumnae TaxID=7897 RepID=H3A454_LATCH|nr:PREDICTED: interferon gamma receptor 1 isoform X2 [Latimeria chalumnae]|eukprot:XP_006009680.1 PREDICTED: interferon gamma receptor 1 isoform X2 [Latimeria chalumnae]